jgi:hypothetical protein
MPEDVGVALGVAVGDAVGVGESLADGDALSLVAGVGVGLVADAVVQPVRTISSALAAPSRAIRKTIVMQRCKPPRRAPE